MKDKTKFSIDRNLEKISNAFFLFMAISFSISSFLIIAIALSRIITCAFTECDLLINFIDFVGFLIISVAIFDVGRYLLEEEVFRNRELRSPKEARRSLTKFMVIIVIAVTLEALLNIIRASTSDISLMIIPTALFFVATILLIGLGLYQRLSVSAEKEVEKNHSNVSSE